MCFLIVFRTNRHKEYPLLKKIIASLRNKVTHKGITSSLNHIICNLFIMSQCFFITKNIFWIKIHIFTSVVLTIYMLLSFLHFSSLYKYPHYQIPSNWICSFVKTTILLSPLFSRRLYFFLFRV